MEMDWNNENDMRGLDMNSVCGMILGNGRIPRNLRSPDSDHCWEHSDGCEMPTRLHKVLVSRCLRHSNCQDEYCWIISQE